MCLGLSRLLSIVGHFSARDVCIIAFTWATLVVAFECSALICLVRPPMLVILLLLVSGTHIAHCLAGLESELEKCPEYRACVVCGVHMGDLITSHDHTERRVSVYTTIRAGGLCRALRLMKMSELKISFPLRETRIKTAAIRPRYD